MKLVYIANARIPTEKAHGIQIMKMCQAFAEKGMDVELIVPWRFNKIKTDPFEYYRIPESFRITKKFSLDLVFLGKIGFWIQSATFSFSVFLYLLNKKIDFVYSRDEISLFFLSLVMRQYFWEVHDGVYNFIIKRVLKISSGVVVISAGLKNFFVQRSVSGDKILIAHDGVDLREFVCNMTKDEARKKLPLPQNKRIITYSGSLNFLRWKGVDILLEASKEFSNDYLFIFVGGSTSEMDELKKRYPSINVLFVGHRPHSQIPCYLGASDILILPNKKGDLISEYYTSPLKLFEYMASGRPIIASDLPSIREVLNENNCIFFAANDPHSLSKKIKTLIGASELQERLSRQASEDVKKYDWHNRADNILSFMRSRNLKRINI